MILAFLRPRAEEPGKRVRREPPETYVPGNRRRNRRGGHTKTLSEVEERRALRKRSVERTNGLPELIRLNGIDGRGLALRPTPEPRTQGDAQTQPDSARERDGQLSARRAAQQKAPFQDIQLAGHKFREAKGHGDNRMNVNYGQDRRPRGNKAPRRERDNHSITSNEDVLEGSCDSVESESSSLAPARRNQNKVALNNLKLRIHGQQKTQH